MDGMRRIDSFSRSRSPSPISRTDLSGHRYNNGWTKDQEDMMADWADIAGGYRWMHDKYEVSF